jgi:hypothetical protein
MMELTCTEFDYVILYLDLSFGELVWFKGAKMMMDIEDDCCRDESSST